MTKAEHFGSFSEFLGAVVAALDGRPADPRLKCTVRTDCSLCGKPITDSSGGAFITVDTGDVADICGKCLKKAGYASETT